MHLNFTRAFETAWKRTIIILFQPLDLGKWFLIGFNLFLAMLAEGGVAFNDPYTGGTQSSGLNNPYTFNSETLPLVLHKIKGVIDWVKELPANNLIFLYVFVAVLYVVFWLVLTWVGCRGQFILLDNIVRNRAALATPWRRYAHQGNVWFPVYVGLVVVSSIVFIAVGAGFLALNWSWIDAERYPAGPEVLNLAIYSLVSLALWLISVAVLFLVRSFVLPVYFKQTMGLGSAVLSVGRLIVSHPVSIFCYLVINLIFSFVAAFLVLLLFCVACCVMCLLACLPFVGSLAMSLVLCQLILPLVVFLRCFQLDCLAQFGPEYDVWIVDVAPATAASPLNPPLPPG